MPVREQFQTEEAFQRALRDYFAAKAMPACYAEYFAGLARNEYECQPGWDAGIASESYRMADAMLAARSQP